jgi:hypothetical protein
MPSLLYDVVLRTSSIYGREAVAVDESIKLVVQRLAPCLSDYGLVTGHLDSRHSSFRAPYLFSNPLGSMSVMVSMSRQAAAFDHFVSDRALSALSSQSAFSSG